MTERKAYHVISTNLTVFAYEDGRWSWVRLGIDSIDIEGHIFYKSQNMVSTERLLVEVVAMLPWQSGQLAFPDIIVPGRVLSVCDCSGIPRSRFDPETEVFRLIVADIEMMPIEMSMTHLVTNQPRAEALETVFTFPALYIPRNQ